jgi:hypothetical protein
MIIHSNSLKKSNNTLQIIQKSNSTIANLLNIALNGHSNIYKQKISNMPIISLIKISSNLI